MFGDLMGNMEEQQKAMQEKLSQIILSEETDGIKIEGTAVREITNISIDNQYFDADRKEELEDLLIVTLNNLIEKMGVEEAKASQSMINDLLPPGMSGLFGQ